jgi:hypothetical protein
VLLGVNQSIRDIRSLPSVSVNDLTVNPRFAHPVRKYLVQDHHDFDCRVF